MRLDVIKKTALVLCLLLLHNCTLDPEKKFNHAVEQYLEKGPAALQELESAFIAGISTETIDKQRLQANENIIYRLIDKRIEILYPVKRNLSVIEGESAQHAYVTDDYCVITDGIQLCIFDGKGDHKIDESIGEKKHPIKSFIISGDNVIYYKNQKLYIYNMILQTNEQFMSETFSPPFAQYYAVKMIKTGGLAGVLAGLGGAYNFSILNLAKESLVLKNLSLSSSKLYMDEKQIYYATGNTGNWEIVQYSLERKKKQSVAKYSDIIDIELMPAGFVYENKKGLWASDYRPSAIKIPFPYQLSGKYRDMVLLKYNETYYIVDFEKMLAGLRKLKDQAPGLFEKSSE